MKKLLTVVGIAILFMGIVVPAFAAPIPNGDTQVSLINDYKVKIGLQYRVMYNLSNIPNGTTSNQPNTSDYDFFNQRMRLNIDVMPADDVGGFMQLEYKKSWGANTSTSSTGGDIPFNRLDARGVRYGYIYYTPNTDSYLAAGIIPLSDQLGDTQFSADWDFNVGGISYNSVFGDTSYRLAFARVVDSFGNTTNVDVIGEDANLLIADATVPVGGAAKVGLHVYHLNSTEGVSDAAYAGAIGTGNNVKISQTWFGLSGSAKLDSADVNGFIALNDGDFGKGSNTDNTGWAAKGEAVIPTDIATVSLLGVYSTGDKSGETKDRFRTIQGILGTEGYWAYTHIFTANGPSDVNDLGVDLANGGSGVITVQAKLSKSLADKLSGDIFFGWFQAAEKNSTGDDMGTEIGAMLTYNVAKSLNLQLGYAFASLGDFYKSGTTSPDDLWEVFSRFQLQF